MKLEEQVEHMTKETETRIMFERSTALLLAIVSAISLLAMTGWLFNLPILASLRPGFIPMAPSTALIFLGLCTAEFIFRVNSGRREMRVLVQAGLVGLLSLVFMLVLRYFTGLGPDFEQLLVSNPALLGEIQTAHISPLTALGFFLAIPAFLLLTGRDPGARTKNASAILSSVGLILSGLIVLGYLYGAPPFYGGTLIPVAVTTALSFFFLNLGLLMIAGPACWPVRVFVGQSLKARLTRAFVPASIVIVLLQGLLSTEGDPWIINPAFRVAFVALAASLMIIFIISQIAQTISVEIERGNQARLIAENALNQSEIRFRTLVETVNVAILNIDQNGDIVLWNPAAEMIFGYTAQEVLGKPVDQIMPAEFIAVYHQGLQRVEPGRESHITGKTVEMTGIKKDGSEFPIAISLATWQVGGEVFFTGIIFDISERKQAEELLRKISYRQQVLLSAVPDIIMEVDNNKVYTWANQPGQKFFGEDVIGHEAGFYFAGEEDTYQKIDPLFEGVENILYIENWQRRWDGEKRLLAWWCQGFKDEKGNITGVLSTARDITERQQSEEALRESEERYRSLYENVPIGIYRTSPDGHILLANPMLVRMLGYTTFEELSQRNLATGSYEPEYPRDEFKERIERDGEVRGLESIWKCKDGSSIYVRENTRFVRDENNQSSYYEGTVEDISEQKKIEEALRKSELSLQSVLLSTADGILAVGSENEILYVSERFAELWRIPPSVMSSKDDSILLGHVLDQLSDPQGFLKKVQELYQSKEESFDTLTFKDGRVFERLSRPLIHGADVIGRVWSFRDISESKQIEEKLEKERILLRTLIDNIPDRVYVMDSQGRKVISNLADLRASGGKTMEDVIGKTDLETYPPELAEKFWAANMEVIESGISIINREEPGLDSQGNPVWVLSSKVPLRDGQGKITGLVGVGRDITGRKNSEELQDAIYRIAQAADQAESLDSLYPSIHAIIQEVMIANNFYFALYDEKNDRLSFPYYIDQFDEKPSAPTPVQGLTGYVIRSEHSLLATREILDRLVQQGEVEMMGTGSVDWLGVPLKFGGRTIGVMASQSYTPGIHFKKRDMELLEFVSTQVAQAIERKRLEEEIRSLSLTDELTGLYNRRGFTLLAEREVKLAHRMNRSMLLFFGDMDNFKSINDTWGHAQGDLALKEISALLKENFRESDILARIGGDEFVILAIDGSQESAEAIANRIQTCFSRRNQQAAESYQLSLSLGIAHFNPDAPRSVSELIAHADGLMYEQKQAKKGKM